MIRNVIFDLGNVLIRWTPFEFLSEYTSDETLVEWFLQHILRNELWNDFDRGIYSISQVRNLFLQGFPKKADIIEYWFDHWFEIFTPIPETVAMLQQLKNNGYSLYILSNYPKDAYAYVRNTFDFFSLFDGQVISYQVKHIKPDAEIYKILLARYELLTQECTFIDDVPSFVEAANNLGMHGIVFTTIQDVIQEIRKLGVTI